MENKFEHLKQLVYEGAKNKMPDINDVVLDRISYELNTIKKLDFIDYFILYSRIIEVCNEFKLLRSYGRGSAPNSIVNYCLDITNINPIEENLIFERFIHPTQKQLPDIDIDIPKGWQKKVIEKLKQNYPEYYTYSIAFLPKSENDYEAIAYNNVNYKIHPCGIAITTQEIGYPTFQFSGQDFYLANDIQNDPYYYDKIDILELHYLNRLQLIANEVGNNYHPYKLPLTDKKVFKLFVEGNLENIFQFNVHSLKSILQNFRPNSIHDLSLINAMFRPGLTEQIPTVINLKFNTEQIFCPSDLRVSEILKETYGFFIYQETFLHLSKLISGISYSDAELWRKKIMRDRSNSELITFSSVFADGCRKHSTLTEIEIASLTNMITGGLRLTFQKSHSLSYSTVAYWGAYYKTYFKEHFDRAFNDEHKFQSFELY